MIISITGTPGTGKTAVAKALAKKLGWKLINLNDLAKEKKLYLGYDRSRRSRIVNIKGLTQEVRKIAKKEGDLILDSHYSHDMPCNLIVILRANPRELRERMARKGWPKKKIEENIEAEIMEIVKSEALEAASQVLEIDTTGKKPERIAEQIVKNLNLKPKAEN